MSHGEERRENRRDDEALGARVEEWVYAQSHEPHTNTPPRWQFWKSPTTEEVVKRQVPQAQWMLDRWIEQLPPAKAQLARQTELKARLLRRVTAERDRIISTAS
jgi:hypothetical protein